MHAFIIKTYEESMLKHGTINPEKSHPLYLINKYRTMYANTNAKQKFDQLNFEAQSWTLDGFTKQLHPQSFGPSDQTGSGIAKFSTKTK